MMLLLLVLREALLVVVLVLVPCPLPLCLQRLYLYQVLQLCGQRLLLGVLLCVLVPVWTLLLKLPLKLLLVLASILVLVPRPLRLCTQRLHLYQVLFLREQMIPCALSLWALGLLHARKGTLCAVCLGVVGVTLCVLCLCVLGARLCAVRLLLVRTGTLCVVFLSLARGGTLCAVCQCVLGVALCVMCLLLNLCLGAHCQRLRLIVVHHLWLGGGTLLVRRPLPVLGGLPLHEALVLCRLLPRVRLLLRVRSG